ncbi:MAG: DNA repair protein RecO [Dehalococcoidia bacterium]
MQQPPLEASRPSPGSRPRSYKTEAIVLRSIPMREADRLITVLTPAMGKLPLTVRGARRITSRLGGHLDVFNHARLTLALGHRIDVVTGAESMESFGPLKADLDRMTAGLYLLELTDALLPEAVPHPAAYGLLLQAIRTLNTPDAPHGTIARYVELRLLEDAGYLPELRQCLACERELTPGHHRYAPVMGGVVCGTCTIPAGQMLPLSVDALKVLRHFARQDLSTAVNLRLSPALGMELEGILASSVHSVLERDMATAGFIDHLRQLRRRAAASGTEPVGRANP